MPEPAFNLNECVEYRWAAGGRFVGEARVVEVLPDGRYRLERIDGAPFPKEARIFAEEQLRLKPAGAGPIRLSRVSIAAAGRLLPIRPRSVVSDRTKRSPFFIQAAHSRLRR